MSRIFWCGKVGTGTHDDPVRPRIRDDLDVYNLLCLLEDARSKGEEIRDTTFFIAQVRSETTDQFEVEVVGVDKTISEWINYLKSQGYVCEVLAELFTTSGKRYSGNPVLSSTSGEWDCGFLVKPSALFYNNEYWVYYYGAESDVDTSPRSIGLAKSSDGYTFTKQGVVLPPAESGWDSLSVTDPAILHYNNEFWLYYCGMDDLTEAREIGLAKSTDGINFTRITNGINGTSKVLEVDPDGWDAWIVAPGAVVVKDGTFYLYYWGRPSSENTDQAIGLATSTDGINFTRITNGIGGTSKVLEGDLPNQERGILRPHVFYEGYYWHMYYVGVAEDNSKRIYYAYSEDGINWTKLSKPVLGMGTADWENDYLPGVTVVPTEGDPIYGYLMYYQGAYSTSPPTNRIGAATLEKVLSSTTATLEAGRFAFKISDVTEGTWTMDFRFTGIPSTGQFRFSFFDVDEKYRVGIIYNNQIGLGVGKDVDFTWIQLTSYTIDTNWHTLKITRDATGNWKVYVDDVLYIDVDDTTYTSWNQIIVENYKCTPVEIGNLQIQ